MAERISKVAHQYAGRDLGVGDRFDCEPQHVALLLAMGRIEREEADETPGYLSRDMVAAPEPALVGRPMQATGKRAYNRKAA